MRISDTELNRVMQTGGVNLVPNGDGFEPSPRDTDRELIKQLVADVIAMPDREDTIAELKARIEKGEYRPEADDIADAMIRRSIADRIR